MPSVARFGAEVEEPARRDLVVADEVDSRLNHEIEVGGGFWGSSEMLALGIGGEGAVGGDLDENFLSPSKKNFARTRTGSRTLTA